MQEVNKSWDDFLYSYIKTVFYHKVMQAYHDTMYQSNMQEEYEFYYTDYYGDNFEALNQIC